eukprot:CAMPEP_0118923478 /NCGR_PEP_ID=MMETSP1169-20130426/1985_1 /TAXON_ID=36882 /ORGANISM="Pyramimonas obovata, Strain CCMP722" /LENGTH=321 /DNA_ID=CAMNT_0006864463 /DNA_START=255 /DNA_END=1220 /DNA_ORIENTATION=+
MLGIMPVLRIYLQDQDAFEEWRPTEKRQTIAERPTGIQRLLSTLGKSEELGRKDTTNWPLITQHMLRNLGLPGLNVSRLVMFGEVGSEEAEMIHVSTKDREDLDDVLPQGKFDHHHHKCAVVGNSRRLLQDNHGPAIDAMDAVLRFNEAPIKNYEAHVGRRTTYRAMSPAYVRALVGAKPGSNGRKLSTGGKTVVIYGEPSVASYVELVRRYPENLNYFLSPALRTATRKLHKQLRERMALVTASAPKSTSRSGYPAFLEAVFFLLQVCQTVHVYGLDAEPNQLFYYDRKEVLAVTSDVVPDQLLMLMLRALNIEGFINIH